MLIAEQDGSLSKPKSRALSSRKLVNLWYAARVDEIGRWGAVRGPIGAAKMSMERIDWKWSQPHIVETDDGTILNFALDSPALIQYQVHQSVTRSIQHRIAKKHDRQAIVGHTRSSKSQKKSKKCTPIEESSEGSYACMYG